ncbi:MAG: TonB-dependent receptor plug domain-containing protein [Bermanella sp.]
MVSIINILRPNIISLIYFTVISALCCLTVNANETELDTLQVYDQTSNYDSQRITLSSQDYAFGDLTSVLGRTPGFQIQTSGGFGAYSSFTFRGSTARSVAVYFDGVKVNDPLTGDINLSTFPLWSLQSVDIYKAIVPAHLANNSGTAVMNLNSQSIDDKQELKVSGGSFGYSTVAGNISGSNYLLSAEWLTADNEFEYTHNNQTPLNSDDDYSTNRLNNQVKRNFALIKGQEKLAESTLNLMAIHRQYETGVGNNLNHARSANLQQSSTLISTNLSSKHWQIYLNGDFAKHSYDDSENEIGLSKDSQDIKYNKYEAKVVNLIEFKNIHSTLSVQTHQETTRKEDLIDDTLSSNKITADYFSIAHNLSLNQNIKFNNSWLKRIESDDTYQTYNSSLGYSFTNNSWLRSDISISKKSRLPTISELYLNQGNIIANPDLEPEKFYEVNSQTKFNFSHIGGAIDFYIRDSKDTIIYSYDARGVGRATNEGKSQIMGLETMAYWHIGKFEINWGLELVDSKNISGMKSNNDKKLPAFFHASQYVSLSYWINQLSLGIANQRQSDMYYDTANSVKAPDQDIWSISANFQHYPWQLGVRINNIFDKYYTGFKTEPLPGRTYIFTFSISN